MNTSGTSYLFHSIFNRRKALAGAVAGVLAPALPTWARPGPSGSADEGPPALALAQEFRPGQWRSGHWVSEKYDGLRGHWDGSTLRTRGGEVIAAPAWFTAGWPATPLDGELWAGRGAFTQALSTVRSQNASEAAWRQIRFMVFDLPAHGGVFDERLAALPRVVAALQQSWVQAVPHWRVDSEAALRAQLRQLEREGAEGLMLRRGDAPYRAGRSGDLLKLKSHQDAEALVLAHLPGQGKHQGQLGALLVALPGGQRFRLGTGLSDAERQHPPAIGSRVTYRYRGHHPDGLPRFASYLRPAAD